MCVIDQGQTNRDFDDVFPHLPVTSEPIQPLGPPFLEVVVTEPHPSIPVAHITGEVDLLTAPQLRADLVEQLATRPHTLVVDLTGVSFLGAMGLGVLDETAQAAAQHAGQLRIVATSRAVLRPLTITQLNQVIPVHPSLHDALNYCTDELVAGF